MIITLIIIYWLSTSIFATYWLVKHPSERHGIDTEYVSILEILGKFSLSLIVAPLLVPLYILASMTIKR